MNAHPHRNEGVRETTPTFRMKNLQTAYCKKNSLRNEASSRPQRNTRSKKTIRLIAGGTKPNCGRRKTQLRIRKAESLKERAAQKNSLHSAPCKKIFFDIPPQAARLRARCRYSKQSSAQRIRAKILCVTKTPASGWKARAEPPQTNSASPPAISGKNPDAPHSPRRGPSDTKISS